MPRRSAAVTLAARGTDANRGENTDVAVGGSASTGLPIPDRLDANLSTGVQPVHLASGGDLGRGQSCRRLASGDGEAPGRRGDRRGRRSDCSASSSACGPSRFCRRRGKIVNDPTLDRFVR